MTEKKWVWVKTTSGMSCLDVESIIAVSHTHDKFGNKGYDLHLTSGTIFTIMAKDFEIIRMHNPDW